MNPAIRRIFCLIQGIRLSPHAKLAPPRPAPPPRQDSGSVSDSEFSIRVCSPPPSFHFTIRSRSFQPPKASLCSAFFPVEVVPPRSPNLDFGCHSKSAERRTPPAKVEIISQQTTSMSYIQQFEAELLNKLTSGTEDDAVIVAWVSEKVLESYRNGITAGQKGTQVIRKGQSRRRFQQQAQ